MRSVLIRSGAAIALFLVACGAGYWVSTHLGRDMLRLEVEQQLSRLLQGNVHVSQASLRFTPRPVLQIVGASVDYRESESAGTGGLSARRATGGIDPLALLAGRFRLEWLTLDGLTLRTGRAEEGPWSPPFMEPPEGEEEELRRREEAVSGSLESWLAPMGWPDGLVRVLLGRPWAARNVRLLDARLEVRDARPMGEAEPVTLALEDIDITIDHDWLDGRPSLRATASVVDSAGARGSIELQGERSRRGELKLQIAATDFPLASLRPYALRIDPEGDLSGRLTGVFDWQSPERGHGSLELDLLVEDSQGGIGFGDERLRLDTERMAVGGTIETTPGRLLVQQLQFRGAELGLEFDVRSERPLRPDARVRARVALLDIGVGTAARVAAALPAKNRETAESLLARIRGGRVRHLTLHGTAALRDWQRLAAGELSGLPPGFRLNSRVEGVTLGLASEGTEPPVEANASSRLLSDMSADFEWEGQRIALWNAHMTWEGRRWPRLDVVAHGGPSLLLAPSAATKLKPGAVPLPGLPALLERFARKGDGPMPPLQIEIDELHHPALRWPVEHALARIEEIEGGGFALSVPHANWAGIPVRARGTFQDEPEPTIALTIWAGEDEITGTALPEFDEQEVVAFSGPLESALPLPAAPPELEPDPLVSAPRETWGRGRLHMGHVDGPFPLAELDCELVLEGAILRVPQLAVALEPAGHSTIRGAIDLGREDQLRVNAAFDLQNADLGTVSAGLSLPPGLFEGIVDMKGALEGTLRSGEALHRGMRGVIEVHARDGRIEKSIPLISAVAHASEGFNPFAARKRIRYETLDGVFELEHGRLLSEELSVDGPVRIFASGEIDMRDDPAEIDALVGVFVLRHADLLLGDVPIVKWLVPGADRGLLGAYFQVDGALGNPRVQTHAAHSLTGGMPLPDVVRAPFKALKAFGEFLMDGASSPNRNDGSGRDGNGRRKTEVPQSAPGPAEAAQ